MKFQGQDKDASKMFFYDIVTTFDSFLAKSQYLKKLSIALFGPLTLSAYSEFSGVDQSVSVL